MAKSVCAFFCVCLCFNLAVSQYGFQNGRSERRYASFFGLPQNLVDIIPQNIRNIPGRLTSIVYRPEGQKNQYGNGQNNYQNPSYPNGNAGHHSNLNVNQANPNLNQNENPSYPNGNPVNNQYDNQVTPSWNQNGNAAEPNWNQNGNAAQPNWNQNGNPVNPNQYDNYQNGNQNTDNHVNGNGKPINQPISTEPPASNGENIPNDYVNFDDAKPSTSSPVAVTEGVAEGKNNEDKAEIPDNFEDRHGEDTTLLTEAPLTHLQALTPVDSRDSVSFNVFQDSCTTVEGGSGTCTVIFSCPQYSRLLTQARSSPAAVQLLRKVHCGFEGSSPKVCCPSSSIPTSPPITTTTTAAPDSEGREADDVLLKPPQCGVSNATSSRVVGGAPARLADFPWMALLGYKPRRGGDGPRWLCGGSLISARHVLTAAHCIQGHEDDLYQVRLGELDLAREDDGATPTDVPVQMKIKHAMYDAKAFTNDIGLLLLARAVEFTFLIRPICIPQDRELRARSFENYTPTIAGWGDTEFRGPAATHLQALQLPVVSNEFCANAYKQYKAQVIDERVLCAGYKKGGHDACQGDSGGPLMQPIWLVKEHVTYFYQIGVVSFGKKCAEIGFPGVYTRVTKFTPWIQEQVAATQNL